MTVATVKGEVAATVYIANPLMLKEGLRPSQEYIDHLLAGKRYLSESYYKKLQGVSTMHSIEGNGRTIEG